MITELMWKSLDRLSTAYSFICPVPLEWDRTDRKLVYNPYSWKMAPWTVAMLLLIIYGEGPCFILAALNLFGVADVPLKVMVVTMIFTCLGAYGIVVNLGGIFFADKFAIGFNFLKGMEREMSRKTGETHFEI